ncbi:hypothetical protein [Streptococcus loxodontisalivarius]|uniref:Uncharacterized protein n=1 Tax=Streptococcus loxodontisalivarius TaxID=1349415 RepID=A0ABS2PRU4_9STRE|nr:hypothetical protein [Streptococcus loxodontisalivarius]MBM7642710.1 hypothetical protein [Streptococcus loxodontisalivarius]
MINKTVLGIRTHKWDANVSRAFEELSAYFSPEDIYVICDELAGQSLMLPQGINKISLSREFVENSGLKSSYKGLDQEDWYNPAKHKPGWLCGDYFYYAFQQAVDADFYWLFEADVYLTPSMRKVFFERLDSLKSDALLSYFAPANESWYWKPKMEYFEDKVYKTYFPFSRLSAKAVACCLAERRRISQRFREEKLDDVYYPNDESLVATTLAKYGLDVVDLRACFEADVFQHFSIKSTVFTSIDDELDKECHIIHPYIGDKNS